MTETSKKDNVVTPQEYLKIEEEVNNKRNDLYNQSNGVDKK